MLEVAAQKVRCITYFYHSEDGLGDKVFVLLELEGIACRSVDAIEGSQKGLLDTLSATNDGFFHLPSCSRSLGHFFLGLQSGISPM